MTKPEAAVAIVRAQKPEPAVLLMRRAERDGDPWSGHWSFPGGHIEPEDSDLLQTAIRELREECGVFVTAANLESALPDAVARRKAGRYVTVAPFVFALPDPLAVTVDPAEAVEGRWLPLSLLADPAHHKLRPVPGMPAHILFPTVDLPAVPLWGFTYRLITEWLRLTPAPEASAQVARDLLEYLVSAGVTVKTGWHAREAVVEGPIPIEAALEYLSGHNSRIPAVNAVDVRPDAIRVMDLSFQEYIIRAG